MGEAYGSCLPHGRQQADAGAGRGAQLETSGNLLHRAGGFLAQAYGYLQLLGVAFVPRGQLRLLPALPAQLLTDDALSFGLGHLQPHLPKVVLGHLALSFPDLDL